MTDALRLVRAAGAPLRERIIGRMHKRAAPAAARRDARRGRLHRRRRNCRTLDGTTAVRAKASRYSWWTTARSAAGRPSARPRISPAPATTASPRSSGSTALRERARRQQATRLRSTASKKSSPPKASTARSSASTAICVSRANARRRGSIANLPPRIARASRMSSVSALVQVPIASAVHAFASHARPSSSLCATSAGSPPQPSATARSSSAATSMRSRSSRTVGCERRRLRWRAFRRASPSSRPTRRSTSASRCTPSRRPTGPTRSRCRFRAARFGSRCIGTHSIPTTTYGSAGTRATPTASC